MVEEIGEGAGRIWQCLKDSGEMNPSALAKKSGLKRDMMFASIGWLAREGKLSFRGEKRSVFISLA